MYAARSAVLALLFLTVAIAGCSALTDSPDTNNPTDTATPLAVDRQTPNATPSVPTFSPTQPGTSTPYDPSSVYTNLDSNLGVHEKPHGIRLVNNRTETVVAATIRITREDADYTTEETHNLAPGEEHYGVIDYKANYTVTVIVGDQTATKPIPSSTFDCNNSTTTLNINEDNFTVRTISTTMGCPTPVPAE